MTREKSLLTEAAGLTVIAIVITAAVTNKETPFLKEYGFLISAASWLYLPLIIMWARKEPLDQFALDKIAPFSSIIWAAIWILITFPVFYLAWEWIQTSYYEYKWTLIIPDNLSGIIIFQFLATAIPEELFFRGYLQGRMNRILGKNWSLWGADIGPGLFIAAAVFALCHLVIETGWMRLAVFLPAMLMGWMREKTGSIVAPVIFHTASNISYLIAINGLYKP